MINRKHKLPVVRQAKLLGFSRAASIIWLVPRLRASWL